MEDILHTHAKTQHTDTHSITKGAEENLGRTAQRLSLLTVAMTFLPQPHPQSGSLSLCLGLSSLVLLLAFGFLMPLIKNKQTNKNTFSSYAHAVFWEFAKFSLDEKAVKATSLWLLGSQRSCVFLLCLFPCKSPTYSGCLTNI